MMPDVVFFGGNIPKLISERTQALAREAGVLVVLGSSLKVYSGYRLCRLAVEAGGALVIVNPGPTRADAIATQRFDQTAEAFTVALSSVLEA
jgi:NAD-dependent SIR2 family protein deacetylase